jgi:hypothetical protein
MEAFEKVVLTATLVLGIPTAVLAFNALTGDDDDVCDGVYAVPEGDELFLCHEGPAVRDLQMDLRAYGLDVEPTSHYDKDTRQAVIDFQTGHGGLVVDGMAGPDTRRELAAALAERGG